MHALVIVQRGWAKPPQMIGSWAGAMVSTQWMPRSVENGVDFNDDGHVMPFGKPDDALAGTARYLVERENYRRGERWGYKVTLPAHLRVRRGWHSYAQWHAEGVWRRRQSVPAYARQGALMGAGARRPGLPARAEFLCGAVLQSVDGLHARAGAPRRSHPRRPALPQAVPGGERIPTLAE